MGITIDSTKHILSKERSEQMKKKLVRELTTLLITAILLTSVFSVSIMAAEIKSEVEQCNNWEYGQEPAGYRDEDWTYEYQLQEYGYKKLVGAYYKDEYYAYLYNENDVISGMTNDEGVPVVRYVYDENGVVSEVLS